MFCCAGLIAGLLIGQYLGGIWTLLAPVLGFVFGLIIDIKFLHKKNFASGKIFGPIEPKGSIGKADSGGKHKK